MDELFEGWHEEGDSGDFAATDAVVGQDPMDRRWDMRPVKIAIACVLAASLAAPIWLFMAMIS